MKKKLALITLLSIFSCTKEEIIVDDEIDMIRVESRIMAQSYDVNRAKKWYDNEMAGRTNAITENNISWDWANTELRSKHTLSIESLSSDTDTTTFRLEIKLDHEETSATVFVLTPYEDYIREVAMNLDGSFIYIKKLQKPIETRANELELLPTTSSARENDDPPNGGGSGWVWDSILQAWVLPEIILTFERDHLNNFGSFNFINWSNVNQLLYSQNRPSGSYNSTYSYTSGGSGGSTRHSVTGVNTIWDGRDVFLELGPDIPILNMIEFTDCISIFQSAVVTVYADQPVRNNSTPISSTLDVGHAFVSITQGTTSITFGFYPQEEGKGALSGPSQMGNDGGRNYDVSISRTVSSDILVHILNASINYANTYRLNDYNCTDFARQIGNIAGMGIEDAWGIFPGTTTGGENPGKLGEVIRGMSNNGGNTINRSGGNAPSISSGCQ